MIWFIPFSQLKHRPTGSKWFIVNFVAMVCTSVACGLLLHFSDFQQEAIVGIIIFIAVLWALFVNLRIKRFS